MVWEGKNFHLLRAGVHCIHLKHSNANKIFNFLTIYPLEKERVEDLLFGNSHGGGNYKNIFHVALGSGDESSVQVCLEQDSEIVRQYLQSEIKHGDGYMIHTACKNGMEKALLRMVEAMGHLDTLQLNRKDRLGFTPIHK